MTPKMFRFSPCIRLQFQISSAAQSNWLQQQITNLICAQCDLLAAEEQTRRGGSNTADIKRSADLSRPSEAPLFSREESGVATSIRQHRPLYLQSILDPCFWELISVVIRRFSSHLIQISSVNPETTWNTKTKRLQRTRKRSLRHTSAVRR